MGRQAVGHYSNGSARNNCQTESSDEISRRNAKLRSFDFKLIRFAFLPPPSFRDSCVGICVSVCVSVSVESQPVWRTPYIITPYFLYKC